jgi:FlaA1/EpsC-like NDP-sugar epimerase
VVPIALACVVSAVATFVVLLALRDLGSFPLLEVLVVDALLCTVLVGGMRLALRLVPETRSLARDRRRVLLVGAGRAGRGLARELHDAEDARVVGFLDDNPRVRRRRILGITVLGSLDEAARAIAGARAEEVLVTIPDAEPERLEHVVRAAEDSGVPCRIVRRRTEFSAPEPVKAALP